MWTLHTVKNSRLLPNYRFVLTFLCLLFGLYATNLAFIAITDEKGRLYSALLAGRCNYIEWLRNSYLYAGATLSRLIGLQASVSLPFKLVTPSSYVQTVYDCLGINLFCFWTAFVWAHKASFLQNVKWFMFGFAAIWCINCLRMVVLLYVIEKRWNYHVIDHHTLFNVVAYLVLGSLLVYYVKQSARHVPSV